MIAQKIKLLKMKIKYYEKCRLKLNQKNNFTP